MPSALQSMPRLVGRYLMSGPIALGGMASVHLGKLNGPVGFRRTVAIKHMLETYAANPQARAMLIDEAHLAARVNHANVVQTLDVVEHEGEVFLVLEYVHGESLDHLLQRAQELGRRPPLRVVCAVLVGVLRGLHAAHEARSEDGQPLELVHRDLSPHNILVDVHGIARVLDFGVARARGRLQATQDGQLKGKLAYLAPEQIHGDSSRRSDVFTAGVVLWESLVGRQLFQGTSEGDLLSRVLLCKVPALDSQGLTEPALQAVLDRALDRDPSRRFSTAAEMADAVEACGCASSAEVGAWVRELAGELLETRARALEALEQLPAVAVLQGPAAGAPTGTERGLHSRGRLLGATAGVTLTLAGVGVAALWWQRPPPAASGRAPSPPATAATAAPLPPLTEGVRASASMPLGDQGRGRSASLSAEAAVHRDASGSPVPPGPPLVRELEQPPTVEELEPTLELGFGQDRGTPAPVPAAARPVRRGTLAAAATRVDPCSPPFLLDDAGVRRRKPECPPARRGER